MSFGEQRSPRQFEMGGRWGGDHHQFDGGVREQVVERQDLPHMWQVPLELLCTRRHNSGQLELFHTADQRRMEDRTTEAVADQPDAYFLHPHSISLYSN